MSPEVLDAAERLWKFHQLPDDAAPTDVGIGLGSHDIGVAEHAANLYHEDRFPFILFTGANAPTTIKEFPRGEAVHFAERAVELGVPPKYIIQENKATNTEENFTFSRRLLAQTHIDINSATIICRPYQQRRALATATKKWPDVKFNTSSQHIPFTTYVESIGDASRVVNMLVGDTQRIWVYAERGFASPQYVDPATFSAFKRLCEAGYVNRLVDSYNRSE